MKVPLAEKERLQFSGRVFKRYALSELYSLPLDYILKEAKGRVEVKMGFKDRLPADKFLSHCEKVCRYQNAELKSYTKGDEFIVEISLPPENPSLLYPLTSSKWFHFPSFLLIKVEGENGKIKSFGDLESVRRGLTTNYSIPKMPYKSRISLKKGELERIKIPLTHWLLQYFGIEGESYGALRLLWVDCSNRDLAYEQLAEKESHIRWRIGGGELFARSPSELEEIVKEIILNRGFAIYPRLAREYLLDEKEIMLQDRLVIEADPRNAPFKSAVEVIRRIDEILEEEKIEREKLFSGSKSYRLHISLKPLEILNSFDEILDEFPYVGILSSKSIEKLKEEEKYRLLLRALSKALYIKTGLRMRREGVKVKFTTNKFYIDLNAILLDFPSSVSIAAGSPKSLVEARVAKKYGINVGKLEEIGYVPLCCIPVEEFYDIEKVYKLSNIFSAEEIAENVWKRYEERMRRGAGVKEVRELLDVEESFLKNLEEKGEYWFLTKVVQV
jgi:hypothetical protein